MRLQNPMTVLPRPWLRTAGCGRRTVPIHIMAAGLFYFTTVDKTTDADRKYDQNQKKTLFVREAVVFSITLI